MSNAFTNVNYTRVARVIVLLLVSLPVFAFAADIVRKSDIEQTKRYIQERQASANMNCS